MGAVYLCAGQAIDRSRQPTGRLKRKLVGRSEKVMRQGLIVQSPGYGHAANAESDQHHRLIACGAPLQIRLEDFNHRLGYLAVSRFDLTADASGIGRQCDQRTGSFDVLQVTARQVGVDDRPRERTSGHALRWPFLPALGHLLVQEVSYGFSVELLLVPEMPIEATSRQRGVLHALINGAAG